MSERTNDQRIEQVSIDELKVSKRQARVHPEKQVEALALSIKRFGFVVPLLIDEDASILAGHGRLLAAKKLGFKHLPCLRVHHLTEVEKRAYILADNRLSELSRWDNELLAWELQEIGDLGFPVSVIGYEPPQFDLLLTEALESSTKPQGDKVDQVPRLEPEAVTRRGDTWLLGRHVLHCGDARDPAAYVQALGASELATAVFTDPPYNRSIHRDISRQGAKRHREFAMASGEMRDDEFGKFQVEFLTRLKAVCRDGAIMFVCMDWRGMRETATAGEEVGLELKNLVVWNKTNAGLGTFYRSKHELVFAWKVGTAPHINNFGLGEGGRYRTNVWTYAGVNTFKPERAEELESHPTVKPVALVADAILDVTHRGDIILDPFGGSGTTLIAAQKTGRTARMIELDPLYCDVIVRRFEKLTGRSVILKGGGKTFGELEAKRSLVPTSAGRQPPKGCASVSGVTQ